LGNVQKLRCAIYTRVSTDNQAEIEFNSCEAQEAKIKSFIQSQEDMVIFKVYSDPGFTGANLNRPGLINMLKDIESGNINLVIAYKIDRLTRSPKDFYQLIEHFEKYGVDFISVTERFDTSTPSGRLLRNIMLTFAQFERELASERTKDKMLQRAQKGMWNGGNVPFGYKVENKRLVPDGQKFRKLSRLFEIFVSTQSLAKTYQTLKAEKIPNNKGFPISKSHIQSILRNPVYAGKIKYAGKLWQGNHEPIISEEMFHLAQAMHQKANRTMRPYKNYALAGLVRCKECNSYMTPCHTNKKKNKRTKRYYYYRCTSTFKKDWNSCQTRQINSNRLEQYIFDNLERISLDKQYMESFIFSLNYKNGGGRIGIPEQSLESSKNPGENRVSGDRAGLELNRDTPTISPKIVAQTLDLFIKFLSIKKGVERNLLVKKYIKSIIYSKESIQINLFYSTPDIGDGLGGENPARNFSPKNPQNSVRNLKLTPRRGLPSSLRSSG